MSDSSTDQTGSVHWSLNEKILGTRLVSVRRQISPEAGRALEILGHAMEYLVDEYLADESVPHLLGNPLGYQDGRVEAASLLAAVNRQIYFACPEVPRLRDRILGFVFRHIPLA